MAALLAGVGSAAHGQTAAYTISDQDVRVGINSGAYGINNAGQVVGYLAASSTAAFHATLFGGYNFTTTDLGTLGGTASYAYAINDSGQIAGNANFSSSGQRAVLWSVSGSTVAAVTLSADGTTTDAYGINNAGLVVGDTFPTRQTPERATAFVVNGSTVIPVDLGGSGSPSSLAYGVNDGGWVASFIETASYDEHAVLYQVSGTRVVASLDLNTATGSSDDSGARAVNSAGQAVGTRFSEGDNLVHGMLWTVHGSTVTAQDIGRLADSRCFPLAINGAGQVVGNADIATGSSTQHAFVYTAAGGIQDLNQLVGTNPIATNIVLGANGHPLNEWGQIAATGTVQGHSHALLLSPVTPVSTLSSGVLDCKIINGASYQAIPAFNDPNGTGGTANIFSLLNGYAGTYDPGPTYGRNRDVTISAVADPSTAPVVGSAFSFQGTNNDETVVQIAYGAVAASTLFGTETNARLGWYNGTRWVNAVDGNTGVASGQRGGFSGYRAYDPAKDFAIGDYGIDPNKHTVWAVIDHGGTFGVILDPEILRQTKAFARSGTVSTLTVDSFTGHTYQLQRAALPTPDGGSFADIGAAQNGSTGAVLNFTDNAGTAVQGFYRLKVTP